MSTLASGSRPRYQRGQAALLVVVLVGMVATLLVYGMIDTTSAALRRDQNTAATMAEVKRALIGWSAARDPAVHGANARPGELPCPDINPLDGSEDGSCAAGAIGRVPWRTLGIPEPKDEAGETLWYAIAGPFRIWGWGGIINSDTKGNITVYQDSTATVVTTEAVAVIFAAGSALGAQDRNAAVTALCPTTGTSIALNVCPSNYLETAAGINNATTNGPFMAAPSSATFNDKVMVITTSDLMPPVEQRVAREMLRVLNDYKQRTPCCPNWGGTSGCYPWADTSDGQSDADPFNSGNERNRGRIPFETAAPYDWGTNPCGTPLPLPGLPAWFDPNNWHAIVYYSAARDFLGPNNNGYPCVTCVSSTLTVDVASKEVVILMPGPNLGTSPRSPVGLSDPTYWQYYLEDVANYDHSDDMYVTPTNPVHTRDRIFTIP